MRLKIRKRIVQNTMPQHTTIKRPNQVAVPDFRTTNVRHDSQHAEKRNRVRESTIGKQTKKKRGRYKLAAPSTDIWANESPGTARLPKEAEKLQTTQNFRNRVPHHAHAVMRGTEHTKTEKVGGNYFYDKPSTQRYFKKKKKKKKSTQLERGREELEKKKNTHSAWVRLLATK